MGNEHMLTRKRAVKENGGIYWNVLSGGSEKSGREWKRVSTEYGMSHGVQPARVSVAWTVPRGKIIRSALEAIQP